MSRNGEGSGQGGTRPGMRTMKRTGTAAVVALAAALAAPAVHAEPETVAASGPVSATPNKLAAVVGLASPWGELGISYQRRLRPSFALETGIGTGATGLQLVALPKWLFGSGGAHLYIEAGPSLTLENQVGAGLWATGEVGFESTFGNWTLGFGAGAGLLVAGEVKTPICFDECSTRGAGAWLPEIRLAIGRNF